MARFHFDTSAIPATDPNGVPYSGAKLLVRLNGTTTNTTSWDSFTAGSANTNPVIADSAGRFPPVYGDVDIVYRLTVTNASGSDTIYDRHGISAAVPSGVATYAVLAGTGGAALIGTSTGETVEDRLDVGHPVWRALFTTMAGTPPDIDTDTNVISSSGYSLIGRGVATYIHDAAVDAAFVALYPTWSFLAADGRGFRMVVEDEVSISQFGAVGDGVTDNYSAIRAAMACVYYFKANTYPDPPFDATTPVYAGIAKIRIPVGNFLCNTTIDVDNAAYYFEGVNSGDLSSFGYGSELTFPASTAGFIVHRYNTSVHSPTLAGGDGSTFRNFKLYGGGGAGDTAPGIWFLAMGEASHIGIRNFAGDGICIGVMRNDPDAANRSNNEQAAGTKVYDCYITRVNGAGIYIQGGNASVCSIQDNSIIYTAKEGIRDSGFLGSTIINNHIRGNGYRLNGGTEDSPTTKVCICSHGGTYWQLAYNQESVAHTTEPGTNELVWSVWGPGGPDDWGPAWTSHNASAANFRSCPSIAVTNANATSLLLNNYMESDGPRAWLGPLALNILGQIGLMPGTGGADLHMTGASGHLVNLAAGGLGVRELHYSGATLADTVTIITGGDKANGDVFKYESSLRGIYRIKRTGEDFYFWSPNNDANAAFAFSGTSTAQQFGTGAALPYVMNPAKFALGEGANARRLNILAAAPTTGAHGRGEVVYNLNAAVGQPKGWQCTVAGTPGTWVSMGNL